jgi:hypothetical protein
VLERTGKDVAWLPGEQAVAILAPPRPGNKAIGPTYDPLVQAARSRLSASLSEHYGQQLFSKNLGSVQMGLRLRRRPGS